MSKEVVIYKRDKMALRFMGLLFAGISVMTICFGIIDSMYNNKALELSNFTFPIVLIIVGICIYKFVGVTKKVIVAYNDEGFSLNNKDFIAWNLLKSWTIEVKEKINDPSFKGVYSNMPYLFWFLTFGTSRTNKLKLMLTDGREIVFSNDDVSDMLKFIKYLKVNFNDLLKMKK